jgi:hypothetical protein
MRRLYLGVIVLAGAACILVGTAGWKFFFAKTASRPAVSSPAPPGNSLPPGTKTRRLDVHRPIYVQEGAIACEDPRDFEALSINAEAFTSLDQGDYFQSCLEWNKRRVRILRYQGQLVDVVDADIPHPAGKDAWVQIGSLQN